MSEILNGIIALVKEYVDSKRPLLVPVPFPLGHPEAGNPSHWLIHPTYKQHDAVKARIPVPYAKEIHHKFEEVEYLARWAGEENHDCVDPSAWVSFAGNGVVVVVEGKESFPGSVRPHCNIVQSRTFQQWAGFIASASSQSGVSHEVLADFFLDHRNDFEVDAVVAQVASFGCARTLEYDADLDSGAGVGIKMTWGEKKGATQVQIPRDFWISIPVYADDLRRMTRFRVSMRLLPPKKGSDNPAPSFRLSFLECETSLKEARSAMIAKLESLFGEIPLYAGEANHTRYSTGE